MLSLTLENPPCPHNTINHIISSYAMHPQPPSEYLKPERQSAGVYLLPVILLSCPLSLHNVEIVQWVNSEHILHIAARGNFSFKAFCGVCEYVCMCVLVIWDGFKRTGTAFANIFYQLSVHSTAHSAVFYTVQWWLCGSVSLFQLIIFDLTGRNSHHCFHQMHKVKPLFWSKVN